MSTASYHKSKTKHKNRRFKLSYFRRAVRFRKRTPHKETGDNQTCITLCGNQLWTERKLVDYFAKHDINGRVISFNNNHSELADALNERAKSAPLYANNILLLSSKLTPDFVQDRRCTLIDFDTCSWFLNGIIDSTVEFCKRADLVAITVIIKGQITKDEWLVLPPDLAPADIRGEDAPTKIGEWLEKNTPLNFLDYRIYRNPGAASTMATIIMGKQSLRSYRMEVKGGTISMPARAPKQPSRAISVQPSGIPTEEEIRKDMAGVLIRYSFTVEQIAKALNLSARTVGAKKAWLHPNLANKRKVA